ncbi:MAG TPA: hypothetical protein VII06_29220 [Chloroflexota bacterium]
MAIAGALRQVSPQARDLLWHLADSAETLTLNDAALPEGGLAAWEGALGSLWRAGLLERADWGRTVHVRLTERARRVVSLDGPESASTWDVAAPPSIYMSPEAIARYLDDSTLRH